ncbi:MAG: hypothetical protein ABW110_16115, partial [Steroidobacteraceae bacterium]
MRSASELGANGSVSVANSDSPALGLTRTPESNVATRLSVKASAWSTSLLHAIRLANVHKYKLLDQAQKSRGHVSVTTIHVEAFCLFGMAKLNPYSRGLIERMLKRPNNVLHAA